MSYLSEEVDRLAKLVSTLSERRKILIGADEARYEREAVVNGLYHRAVVDHAIARALAESVPPIAFVQPTPGRVSVLIRGYEFATLKISKRADDAPLDYVVEFDEAFGEPPVEFRSLFEAIRFAYRTAREQVARGSERAKAAAVEASDGEGGDHGDETNQTEDRPKRRRSRKSD